MIQEPLSNVNSPFTRIDPRLKIVFAVFYSFAVALSNEWAALFASVFISVATVFLARLKFCQVLKKLYPALGFILFLWAVLPLTVPGELLYQLGPLAASKAGIFLAIGITFKSIAILLAFIALLSSTSIAIIGHALQKLHVPEKLVYLFLFCYRYIFVIEQEYRRLEKAARLRCFQPRTNLHTYRTFAYLIGMLFLRSSLRADQVHKAMICRGFSGQFYCLEKMAFRRQDRYWAIAMSAALIMVITLEWLKNPS